MRKISYRISAFLFVFLGVSAAQSGTATRIYTVPDGLKYYVDGQLFDSATTAFWPVGSKHVLTAPVSQIGGLNNKSQYAFASWQFLGGKVPGGTTSVTVTADPSLPEFFATYNMQYALDLQFNTCTGTPECPIPGTIYINDAAYTQDAEIFYGVGTVVQLVAVPAPGFVFDGWAQGDNQAPQGMLNTVTMRTPSVVRPRFVPAKKVTFLTDPPQLGVYADRALVTSPTTFDWGFGTTHAIGAPSPQMDTQSNWWVFTGWSDGGALNHSYTVPSGGPTLTLTASFVRATATVLDTNPRGLSLKIDGRDNWPVYSFAWAGGETHAIEAPAQQTDSAGHVWNFVSWSNGGARAQSYVAPASDGQFTTVRLTANYEPVGHLLVSSTIDGLSIKVDGADCGLPCDVRKPVGTVVKLSAPASLPVNDNTREDFDGWPGTGSPANDWTLTLGADPVMPNLTYHPMNRLVASANPPDGAAWRMDPTSPDGYYNPATSVKVTVAAQPGYRFRRWGGDAAGSSPTAVVAMNAPRAVQAVFDRIPYIAPAGVVNAAGTTPVAGVAAGSIVSIFGASFATDVTVGPAGPLAQALGCTTVRIADRMLPLFFVSPTQINFSMPDDLAPGDQRITVSCDGLPDVAATVTIARNAPGLFQDGSGNGIVVHEDGSAVTADAPAKHGELLTIYGTGFGPASAARPFGFPLPADPVYTIVDGVTVQVGDTPITAENAFGVAGSIGVDAAQFRLPDGTPSGNLKVKVTVNGADSNTLVVPAQ